MISRYLFRDDVLIATGTSMHTFDDESLKDDLMLSSIPSVVEPDQIMWMAYRMTQFPNLSWGWFALPKEEATRLRALLLLQQ